jgi:hypothetical protein
MADQFKACSVVGCKSNAHTCNRGRKGYCSSHYRRLKLYGDPVGGRTIKGEPMRFVEEVVLPYSGDECLAWPYSKRKDGYGNLWVNGAYTVASRHICKLAHGEPPTPEHEAAHSCGNGKRGCVTKRHLSWKTRSENEADKITHGTDRSAGEKNPNAKVADADIAAIMSMTNMTHAEIAKIFGISRSHVSNIRSGVRRSACQ